MVIRLNPFFPLPFFCYHTIPDVGSELVTLISLDRATKQPIRKTVGGSGESIHQLNCGCKEQNKIFTLCFIFSRYFWVNKYNKTFSLIDFQSLINDFYCHHFAFSIHQLSPHKLNKGSQLVGWGGSTSCWYFHPFLHRVVIHLCTDRWIYLSTSEQVT